jgi:RNA polymerase sigma factor (sigma-70 family)
MKIEEAHHLYVLSPTPENYNQFGEALLKYIKAVIATEFGTRFLALEDAVGGSAGKVLENLPDFNPNKGSLPSWIYSIVCNTCRDMLRQHTWRSEQRLIENENEPQTYDFVEKFVANCLLEQLPETEQDFITMKLSGLSNEELAEEFGITIEAAKSKWSRVLLKLRTLGGGQSDKYVRNFD